MREGFTQQKSIHQIVVTEQELITQEKWDEVFTLENLINPQFIQWVFNPQFPLKIVGFCPIKSRKLLIL